MLCHAMQNLALQRAVSEVGSAAAARGPATQELAVAALDCFRQAESGMAAERSASGYTAICLEDSWQLAADVLARR